MQIKVYRSIYKHSAISSDWNTVWLLMLKVQVKFKVPNWPFGDVILVNNTEAIKKGAIYSHVRGLYVPLTECVWFLLLQLVKQKEGNRLVEAVKPERSAYFIQRRARKAADAHFKKGAQKYHFYIYSARLTRQASI